MDALTAEEIMHVDLGNAFRSRFKNPYAVVHRGDLHGVFLKACRSNPRRASDTIERWPVDLAPGLEPRPGLRGV